MGCGRQRRDPLGKGGLGANLSHLFLSWAGGWGSNCGRLVPRGSARTSALPTLILGLARPHDGSREMLLWSLSDAFLGLCAQQTGIYQCQPSPEAHPEPSPSPVGCGRDFGCCIYQLTFCREPLPPCTELPLSSMGPYSSMRSGPRLITGAGSSDHFPALQHVQGMAALSCPFPYGTQWSWSLFIAGNGET